MEQKAFVVIGTAQEFNDWLDRFQRKRCRRWPTAITSLIEGEGSYCFTYHVPTGVEATNGAIHFHLVEYRTFVYVICRLDDNRSSTGHFRQLWHALRQDHLRARLPNS